MAIGQWSVVLKNVQRAFQGAGVAGLSEGQLLDRFIARRDENAFEAIVSRHGPMVLGVCRRILVNPVDVEDAFQATFLILVKKADSVRDRDQLGPWLHRVAHRVAGRARLEAAKRRHREQPEVEMDFAPGVTLDADLLELQTIIRDEVDRLSANERAAVVTCYLEGLTHEEAADRLGWPVGTVKGRLARARDRLRGRLARRGVAIPSGAIAPALLQGASPAVPLEMMKSTILAASRLAAGQTLMAGIVSAHCVNLVQGVVGTMSLSKWKLGILVIVAGSVTTPAVLAWQLAGTGANPTVEAQRKEPETKPEGPADPPSLVKEMATEAKEALDIFEQLRSNGEPAPLESYHRWALRLLESSTGPEVSQKDRIAAYQAYLDRMKKTRADAFQRQRNATGTMLDAMDANYRYNEAARWLAKARSSLTIPNKSLPGVPEKVAKATAKGPDGPRVDMSIVPPADQPRTRGILAKLEESISMNFPNETPLEDVIKYIKQVSEDEKAGLPHGIPIYVDPVGLQDADKTMSSTVALSLEDIPLRTTLRLILDQLDLVYMVKDGLLIITSNPRLD